MDQIIAPDNMLVCVAIEDAFTLGVLSSSVHVAWALAAGGTLEDRPRYNKIRCFETFPFPTATPEQQSSIRHLAEQLDAHRKRQQAQHATLTQTGMYNVLARIRSGEPLAGKDKALHEQGLVSVLQTLHDELDGAVLDAHGWGDLFDISARFPQRNHPRTPGRPQQRTRPRRSRRPDPLAAPGLPESGSGDPFPTQPPPCPKGYRPCGT